MADARVADKRLVDYRLFRASQISEAYLRNLLPLVPADLLRQFELDNHVAPFAEFVVSKLRSVFFTLLQGILHGLVVVLERDNNALGKPDHFGHDLLAFLVNVVFHLDFFGALAKQIEDLLAINQVRTHLQVDSV